MNTYLYDGTVYCPYADAYVRSYPYTRSSDYVYIWAFFKNASLSWCLNTGEQVLRQMGFTILDGAANGNVHVLGRRINPEVIADVVCTRLGQNPTSVVVHTVSSDKSAARFYSEQIRDKIKRAHPLEGDVVLNPVKE